jgi:pSer/pThr/pTyr-binding forkhead associated (FHA) protein
MQPRLAAITGRLKGGTFTIDEASLVIGRETAANLCIADASVSRRHSVIEKNDNAFVITDLESLNGTFVNDVPVKNIAALGRAAKNLELASRNSSFWLTKAVRSQNRVR